MLVLSSNSIFTSLQQHGPFAVQKNVRNSTPFSQSTRQWVKNLHQNSNHIAKYRALRSQLFEFLGIYSFSQIDALINSHELQQQRSQRAYQLLSNMFGIEGTPTEIQTRVYEYAHTADAVINSLKDHILYPYASFVETTNEIEMTHNPIELMLIMFNERYHKKARFEARRKITLMSLAASIDQRERETQIAHKFADFLGFLNSHVWSPKLKIGELDPIYLHSSHAQTDFSCQHVEVLTPTQADMVEPKTHEKLTVLKRRRFTVGSREIPIYVSIRKKPPEAKVLKLLRKNEKNPAVAVDDELGLMAVLDTIGDIKLFQQHLTHSATQANSLMVLEDISDTLIDNSLYQGRAIGSSAQTSMLKFFARLGGMRVEFIIHTNKTWLNYMYQNDVSHNEYEVKRIFDSGVIELLFPHDIFHLDHTRTRDEMIQLFRQQSQN